MKPAKLMGRLANGFEADKGRRVHLVPDRVDDCGFAKALCGAEPGRRSGGWDVTHARDRAITCPRCLARYLRREVAEREIEARYGGPINEL